MSKRSHHETREERWLRKIKTYEERLKSKRRRRTPQIIFSDEENDVQHEEHFEFDRIQGATNDDDTCPEPNTEVEVTTTPYIEVPANDIVIKVPAVVNTNQNSEELSVTSSICDFDPELLQELGEIDVEPVEYGDDLQEGLATRLQNILLNGLKKETREDLLKKHVYPKNVPLSKSPTLNPEIDAMLMENLKLRDKRICIKQDQLGRTLSALGKALSNLLKKSPNIPEVIRTLNDASKLLADSHYKETETRRSLIIPLTDKAIAQTFKERKRDHFLFGDKLGDLIKDSTGIKKTGQLLQATHSNPRPNLNRRGPPTRPYQQRSGQTYQQRVGGPRPTMSYSHSPMRRRVLPAPQVPPATWRHPAPQSAHAPRHARPPMSRTT